MRLSAYLEKHAVSPEEFAERIGVHVATVYRLLGGYVFPKRGNLVAILRETNGEVTADDLIATASDRKKDAAEAAA